MKIICTTIYAITISLLLTVQGLSQNTNITISGFVRDSTSGEALIGTNILLYKDTLNMDSTPYRGAASNTYGFYALPKILPGNYYLIARNIGYKTLISKINVDINSGRVQYDFMLAPESINLREVIVQGEKKDESISSTIDVNPEILKSLPSLSGEVDLFKILQMLPGVKAENELSNGLYVRGGSPDQNLTLVDGAIIYNPSHLGNFASTFNSEAIHSIRLIKGAYPAEYGGRLSSVLDINLRSGTKQKEKGSLGVGLINSHITLEGPLGSNTSYMISGRKMYYDLIQKNIIKNNNVPVYGFFDLNGKITINSSESNVITLSGLYSSDNLTNPDDNESEYDIKWKNAMANFTWLHINSNSLFITSSFSFIDYQFQSILQDKTPNSTANNYYSLSKLRDLNFKSNAEIHWLTNSTLKVGLEFVLHNYSLLYSNFYDPRLETTLSEYPDVVSNEISIFFENKGNFTDWLKTNIGIRGYYLKENKYFRAEPHISAQILLSDNLTLNTAFAITHQFLHLVIRNDIALPTDLWYPSSTKIDPSESRQYVLGFDFSSGAKEYLISLEGYYKDMKNLYEFQNAPSVEIGESVANNFTKGEGEAYGIELFVNKRLGKLTGWIGYTLSWTKRKFDYLNAGKVFYPKYDRRHDVSIVLGYNFDEHWEVGMTWTYATGQGYTLTDGQYGFQNIGVNDNYNLHFNYSNRNSYRLPAYHKLDFSVKYKFPWLGYSFETYISFYNVYNHQNPFAYYTTYKQGSGSGSLPVPKVNQISLFPFIPSIGINMKF
ncbi:MAG TPA: TonB-dependent receptor [Ignavibacteriaceae bacterium]|nr:TonB-dependent receptor [Ignavibacteriaceae bacterium]